MAYTLTTWQNAIPAHLDGWKQRMQRAGATSLYHFLSAATLWPVVQAAQGGEWAAIGALGAVVAGVGSNLVASRIQGWKDEADGARQLSSQLANDPQLRKELDAILQAVDTFARAKEALPAPDRQWFVDTLQAELKQLGNATTFNIQLSGSGVVATHGGVAAGAGGAAVGGNVYGDIHLGTSAALDASPGSREAYLSWLIAQVRRDVQLTGIDPKNVREDARRDLDLAAVYTALMTDRGEMRADHERMSDRERLSALAVLNAEPRLALLGDPGSGKSTFVNFVALCMAGELLHATDANLSVLCTPVPDDDEPRVRGQEPSAQPWAHGPLMPVRVVLRDFVARGVVTDRHDTDDQRDRLWRFIVSELPETVREFSRPLRTELLNVGGLLLLDGLDEVPEADQRRVQVKAAVEQFAAVFPKVRVLVTSRTYAYQRQDWKLWRFKEAVLAPFGTAQIRRFVERWYAFVGQVRGLQTADVQGRAVLLNDAIARNPRLYELATRPLLLTLMASLHAWRGGTLPDQREELYADAVELLLDQWEEQKRPKRADGTHEVPEPSLTEWLRVDRKAVRQVLNRLAFAAHRDQPMLVGTADIAEAALVDGLLHLNPTLDANPGQLIRYLRDRAGILEPRGVGVYAFPHRTFQEYLAACAMTESEEFPENIATLLWGEPNRWREVTLLAGAKAVRGAAANAWALAEALCPATLSDERSAEERHYWGALLAAQVLVENTSVVHVAERNRPKVARIRQWLESALVHGALPPRDRAQAGEALAVLGDPRFRADAWFLPDEPLLGFIEIPAGPFPMGSEKNTGPQAFDEELPQHSLDLPSFYIARYPVTVAQFRAFVEQSGYKPEDENSVRGPLNHPVASLTWHETLKYCAWLTECLRQWQGTPKRLVTLLKEQRWQVTLPSEAEWEKAARGTDGRIYPWGDEFDASKANTIETGIGHPSAVGSFPQGASPYGCLDMAGNVLEWTRSLWSNGEDADFAYSYQPDDGREQRDAPDDIARVLRGGGCWDSQGGARCAVRDRDSPDLRGGGVGFRVVVRP